MSNRDECAALWRASAYEAVPYTSDYPEALLTIPEIFDGSVGQGEATRVEINIALDPETGKGIVRVDDNGCGMKNVSRFLKWAAAKSTDTMHRNGHGMKKCMTKWEKDYETANWWIFYRKRNRDLIRIQGPFLGTDTQHVEVEGDGKDTMLMPSGTQWGMEFDISILGAFGDISTLAQALKEIIQTRYSEEIIQRTEFVINVEDNAQEVNLNSKTSGWHSFQWRVDAEVASGNMRLVRNKVVKIHGGSWTYKAYRITVDGRQPYKLKQMFPTYGEKNMKCSRVHISVSGRMIEAIPVAKLHGRENHNHFNGWIEFVNFIPDDPSKFELMPSPCTTKVSFYENDEAFKVFKGSYLEIQKEPLIPTLPTSRSSTPSPEPPPPAPEPPVAPAPPVTLPTLTDDKPVPITEVDIVDLDSESEEEEEVLTPEQKIDSWGISIELKEGILYIRYGGRLQHHLNGGGREADKDSLKQRIVRCNNIDEAKKIIKAWVKLMA